MIVKPYYLTQSEKQRERERERERERKGPPQVTIKIRSNSQVCFYKRHKADGT